MALRNRTGCMVWPDAVLWAAGVNLPNIAWCSPKVWAGNLEWLCVVLGWNQARPESGWDVGREALLSWEVCPECVHGWIKRKMLFQCCAHPIQIDAQNKSPGWYLPESELFSPLQPSMDICLVTCLGWICVKETMCPGTFWDWAVKQMYMELCFRETLCRWMGCGKIQPTCSPIRLLLPLCNLTTRVRVCTLNPALG